MTVIANSELVPEGALAGTAHGALLCVATFSAASALAGKQITYENGQFAIDGLEVVPTHRVTEHDRRGELQWAYAGLREWVYQLLSFEASQQVQAPQAMSEASTGAAPVAVDRAESAGFVPMVSLSSAGENSERVKPGGGEWASAARPEGMNAGSAALVAQVSGWTRVRSCIAAHPSLTTLLLGLLLLGIALMTRTFGLGLPACMLVALGLTGLWGHRQATRRDNLRRSGMTHIDGMWGTDFELYLVQMFRAEGYEVKHTGRPGDFGADLLLRRAGMLTVVQAKRTTAPVGLDGVREAAAAQAHYGAQHAMVVTNSCFTPNAEKLAESNRVDLWDRTRLAGVVAQHSSRAALSGLRLWWDEFRLGLPRSLHFTWAAIRWTPSKPRRRRSGSKRRGQRR